MPVPVAWELEAPATGPFNHKPTGNGAGGLRLDSELRSLRARCVGWGCQCTSPVTKSPPYCNWELEYQGNLPTVNLKLRNDQTQVSI